MNKTEYLEYCNRKYAEGNPILPDEVYDRLVENTELEDKVGFDSSEERFQHPYPMYSYKKSLSEKIKSQIGTPNNHTL